MRRNMPSRLRFASSELGLNWTSGDCVDIAIVISQRMGQILIRNLEDAVLDALRGRAREHGSSVEEEARRALAAAVGFSRTEWLERIEALHDKMGTVGGESTLDILRRDRARDDADEA
ncbi:MAG TPA: hypothetical protein VFE13_09750 [Caulobacteraceae bacterium]|jgi:plasmid stability protein|nr:hypothetical protein [Caulobacteraceae bacterium]